MGLFKKILASHKLIFTGILVLRSNLRAEGRIADCFPSSLNSTLSSSLI